MIWNASPPFLVYYNVFLWVRRSFGGKIMYYRFFACDDNPMLLLNICSHKDFIVDYLLRIDGSHVETPRLILVGLKTLAWIIKLKIKALFIVYFDWRERWRLHFFIYRELVVHYYLRFWNYLEGSSPIFNDGKWFLNISNLIVKSLIYRWFNTLFLKWI